ncbi:formamidopyrimidine-DNA glycosylase [Pedobacter steynii]
MIFELPYLEICAEIFDKRFKNRVLHKVDIQQEKCLNVSIGELNESLVGNELKKIWREGLSLRFQFKNYAVLEMSLSDSAELRVIEQNLDDADSSLLSLYFSGGQMLSVKGSEEFSRFRLNPVHEIVPDVFSKEMTSEYLISLLSNTEEEIKLILVDQGLIRGIGEAYADEILWYAEISPFSIASKIPLDKVKILYKTIKYVLLDAIKETRKLNTLKFDKADPDLLMIHNAGKKNSPTGKTIKIKIWKDTATYYTDEQMVYK